MEVQFDCDCSAEVSEFTRSTDAETDVRVRCDECGAIYAVTITRLD